MKLWGVLPLLLLCSSCTVDGIIAVKVVPAVSLDPDSDWNADGGSDGDIPPGEVDTDGEGLTDEEERELGTDPLLPDTDGDGFSDAEEVFLGTNPLGEGGACARTTVQAETSLRPVDIMLVVDNSDSMADYIRAIVQRINVDFAEILALAGIDYQLIVLSRHGAIGQFANNCDDHGICIEPPLAAGPCNANAPPALSDTFKHYSICIDSNDSLRKVEESFNGTRASSYFDAGGTEVADPAAPQGWSQWLRDDAFRTFLVVTDDNSHHRAADFIDWMYAQETRYFGTPERPNWRFHSINDVRENPMDPDAPWQPDAALIEQGCWDGTNQWVGVDYQQLALQSGGLRFPYCRSGNYDAVFRAVATSVVETAQLSCAFTPSLDNDGGSADYSRVLIAYESGSGQSRTLKRVTGPAGCEADSFYVVGEELRLCPEICEEVRGDLEGRLQALVACFDLQNCGDGRPDSGEACDDGNRVDGDGCDSSCRIEWPPVI